MSNITGIYLEIEGNLLKIHKVCPHPKGKGQKRITFTRN